jgi:hypothetical protein
MAAAGGERPAQPPDLVLQDAAGRLGRGGAPQRHDQPVGGDHPVGVDQQHREQCALELPTEGDRLTLDPELHGPEQTELHASQLPPRVGSAANRRGAHLTQTAREARQRAGARAAPVLHAQAHAAQLLRVHAGELLHHLAGFVELPDQGVHLLGGGT